jgi:hypothetical protein
MSWLFDYVLGIVTGLVLSLIAQYFAIRKMERKSLRMKKNSDAVMELTQKKLQRDSIKRAQTLGIPADDVLANRKQSSNCFKEACEAAQAELGIKDQDWFKPKM